MENKIEMTTEDKSLPSLCEIRFDCLVTMYEMGCKTYKGGFLGLEEKSGKPQWFKSQTKWTLEMIRDSDPYVIGQQLKIMLEQMDAHIRKYEER